MQVLRNWSTNLRVGFTPIDKSKKTVNPPQFRYIVVFVGRSKRGSIIPARRPMSSQTEFPTLLAANASVAHNSGSYLAPMVHERRVPRYFSPEQHEVWRLHPQRTARHVVLSSGTTMYQVILKRITREQTTVDPSLF